MVGIKSIAPKNKVVALIYALGVVAMSHRAQKLVWPSAATTTLAKSWFNRNVPSADAKQPGGRSSLEIGEPRLVSELPAWFAASSHKADVEMMQ